MLVGLLADDASRLGQLGDQPVCQFLLCVCLILLLLGIKDGLLQLLFSRQHYAVLIRSIEHAYLVTVGNQLAYSMIDFLQGDGLIQLLCHLQVEILGGQRFGSKEMLHAFVYKIAVTTLVALLIMALSSGEHDFLGTIQLALCESVLAHTLGLCHGSLQSTQNMVVLTTD